VSPLAAIIAAAIAVACAAVLLMGCIKILHARGASGRSAPSAEAQVRRWYATYAAAAETEVSTHLASAVPDDEWLAVIKAKAQARTRPAGAAVARPRETGFAPVPWEVVESAR
jgi:hypothetical protein